MPRLTQIQRENVIGRMQAGQRQSEIARQMHVSQSTISRLWARFQNTGSTADAARTGRPRVTTPALDRYIRQSHLRNRFLSASTTARTLPGMRRIWCQTVRNRLHDAGLTARRPYRGPVLTPHHRQARLHWAQRHRHWTLRNIWQHVLFSDESRFLLSQHDRRRRVYRRVKERYHQNCVDEAPPHGGGGVMVWGAISHTTRTALVRVDGMLNARRYIDDILEPHALPLLADPRAVFQQDNARPHTARITMAFLNLHHVNILPWPSMSPDLNPIEHLWDELDRRVRTRPQAPTTHDELFQALQEEWNNIPLQCVQTLTSSMPRRCQAVIASRGSHTQY